MGFLPPWAVGVVAVIIAGSVASLVLSVARKVFRLPSRTGATSDTEITELRQAVDAMQQRVEELEERVDFAERSLTKQRDADRLESPRR